MKLIDADDLAARVAYRFEREPDYDVTDAMRDIDDQDELDLDDVIPKATWVTVYIEVPDVEHPVVVDVVERKCCSICGGLTWYESEYCPSCGAKMEGKERR